MPIFRLEGDKLIIAQETNVELESYLESWFEKSPWALIQDEFILWIGRQTSASVEKGTIYPDLLGVDAEGNLVVVEFKKDEAPREVVGQLLDYSSWANELSKEQIYEIAQKYFHNSAECQDATFETAFKRTFDISENEQLPLLNRKLRLFIVAREIEDSLLRICRFLRTSYSVDIRCIAVSKFRTKSGDEIVNMETRVGDEDIKSSSIPIDQENPPTVREVVRAAARKLTGGDTNFVFPPKDVKKIISQRDANFNVSVVNFYMISDAVNSSTFDVIPITERKYWKVERGKYRLYDPERDKIQKDDE